MRPFSALRPLLTGPVPLLLAPLASPVLPSVVATQGRAPVPPPRTPGRPFSCLNSHGSAEARWDAASALGTPGTGTSLCIRQAVLLLETSQYQKFNFVSKNGFAGVHRERMLCGWVTAPCGHQVPMREGAPTIQGPLCWYGGRYRHGPGCPIGQQGSSSRSTKRPRHSVPVSFVSFTFSTRERIPLSRRKSSRILKANVRPASWTGRERGDAPRPLSPVPLLLQVLSRLRGGAHTPPPVERQTDGRVRGQQAGRRAAPQEALCRAKQ